jgi:hypothetical protein
MKTITLKVPETLEEFQEYYQLRNLTQASIRRDEEYEFRTIGWVLMDDSGVIARAPWLEQAYERLYVKELVEDLFGK